MKYFEKYFDNFILVLAVFLGLANFNNAHADSTTTLNIGSLPTSADYGNTFASASSTPFYDAYYFTIPEAFATSVTTSVTVGSLLGINGLQARLYSGHTNPTSGLSSGSFLYQGWSTQISAGPGVTLDTVVLSPSLPLIAGDYTLQVRGTVSGLGGGSYAGTLNLTPVPEAETYAMFLAGLGLMGIMSRRRKIG
jgi:PEP-CTERM motif